MRSIALLVLLAGCSHLSIDARSKTSTGTATGARAHVHVENRALAAVVVASMFIAAAVEDVRGFRGTPRAELDPWRSIQEQDCTRPVELAGNLKCR